MVIKSQYHQYGKENKELCFAFLTSHGYGTSRNTYFSPQISVSTFSFLGKNTCFLHLLNFICIFFPLRQMMNVNYYGVVRTFLVSLPYLLLERGVLPTQGDNSMLRCSTILLCNSEQELKAYVQYIFNNTSPLLASLRRLKLSLLSKNKDTKEVTNLMRFVLCLYLSDHLRTQGF